MRDRPGMFETAGDAATWFAGALFASAVTLLALYGLGHSAWDVAHMIGGKPVDPPQIPQHDGARP